MSSNPNPASETFGQARQGSVAAIIQVLNERLSDSGIRTRAVVAEGMLQVLCEAPSTEQLEKTTVVDRVRQILENISPHHIRKVNINSRIVKEEQLLWFEEISRDPENALLWSEVITLKRPFFIQRWIRDRNLKPAGPIFRDITVPEPKPGNLRNKVIGGSALALLVLGTAWLFREDIGSVGRSIGQPSDDIAQTDSRENLPTSANGLPPLPNLSDQTDTGSVDDTSDTAEDAGERSADTTPPETNALITQLPASGTDTTDSTDSADASPVQTDSTNSGTAETPPLSSGPTADAFAEAVRIANQASADGQTAGSAADWLDLAARWQRASDLMAQIPEGSEQYEQARERVQTYANNSQTAIEKASAQSQN